MRCRRLGFGRPMAKILALSLLFAGAGTAAHAHPALGDVVVAIVGTERVADTPDTVEMRLDIVNNTDNAVTLRGLWTPLEARITIERRRRVFSTVLWQPVDFLRLEPGETIRLAPPDHRIRVETRAPQRVTDGFLLLKADFGPLGEITAFDWRGETPPPAPHGEPH